MRNDQRTIKPGMVAIIIADSFSRLLFFLGDSRRHAVSSSTRRFPQWNSLDQRLIRGWAPCNSGIASPTNPPYPIAIVPMPRDMALNLIFLGLIGILLGFVALKLGPRLGTSAALGLAFSLGLLAFLFETAISRTKESFSVEPFFVLAFPDLSIVAMAGACFVFVYEFFQARFSLSLTRAEANAHR